MARLSCPKCGYDLRGATGPLCSECGMAFDGERWPDEVVSDTPPALEYAPRLPRAVMETLFRGLVSPRRWLREYNFDRSLRWRRILAYLIATELMAMGAHLSPVLILRPIPEIPVERVPLHVIVEMTITTMVATTFYLLTSLITGRLIAFRAFVRVFYLYRSVYILLGILKALREVLTNLAPKLFLYLNPELYFLNWRIWDIAGCVIVGVWWFAVSHVVFRASRSKAVLIGMGALVLFVVWRAALERQAWIFLNQVFWGSR